MFYYVIVTSYVDRFHDFGINEETIPYTMVPNNYTLGVFNLKKKQEGVVTTPLKKTYYKKGSGRRGLTQHPVYLKPPGVLNSNSSTPRIRVKRHTSPHFTKLTWPDLFLHFILFTLLNPKMKYILLKQSYFIIVLHAHSLL